MFAASTAVLVLYALRGGSFDVVPRSELGIAAWWAVALGWAFGVLPRARLERVAALPVAGLVLLAGWTALSLRWTRERRAHGRSSSRGSRITPGSSCSRSACCPADNWRAAVYGAASGALASARWRSPRGCGPAAFGADAVGASFGAGPAELPAQLLERRRCLGRDLRHASR